MNARLMSTAEGRGRRLRLAGAVLAALVTAAAVGCATSGRGAADRPGAGDAAAEHLADLDANLWVQIAAEYRGAARQAYRLARERLDEALADSSWSAAEEQDAPYREKPPAVILDVDETVLDNSPYQSRLLLDGRGFDPASWAAWTREARAPAVPGALAFTRHADRRGVAVFYVTNRDHELEAATRRNLERLGFPVAGDRDVILTRGEEEGWSSDKRARRSVVAREHRVLLLVGDNLHDFTADAPQGTYARSERIEGGRPGPPTGEQEVADAPERPVAAPSDRLDRRWGREWIVLPNPVYGSWESAVLEGASELSARERILRKMDALVPFRPDTANPRPRDR